MQRRTSVIRMTDTNITLELSPRLQQEQIVTSYIFYLKTNILVLDLNQIDEESFRRAEAWLALAASQPEKEESA
jgi:hypothetical protein